MTIIFVGEIEYYIPEALPIGATTSRYVTEDGIGFYIGEVSAELSSTVQRHLRQRQVLLKGLRYNYPAPQFLVPWLLDGWLPMPR